MIYMCALLPSIVVCTPYLLPEEYNVMAGVLAKPMRDRDDVEREIQQAWFWKWKFVLNSINLKKRNYSWKRQKLIKRRW